MADRLNISVGPENLRTEAVWTVSGQVLTALGGLVSIRLTTELLQPTTYGELALLLTVCAFVTQVVLGGVNAAASRYYAIAVDLGQTENYLHVLMKSTAAFIGGGVVLTALLAFTGWVIQATVDALVWALALFFALISGVNSVINGVINSARLRAVSAIHQAGEVWLRIPLLAFLIYVYPDSALGVLIVYVVATSTIALSQWRFLMVLASRMPATLLPSEQWGKRLANYALPYVPWTFIIWIQQVSDRWALEYFVGTYEVGVYAVLFQLGFSSLSMLFMVGVRFIQPIVYQHANVKSIRGESRRLGDKYGLQVILLGACIGSALFLVTFFFHQPIFSLFVGAEYRQFSHYLPWLILSSTLFGTSEMLLLKMQTDMKVQRLSAVKILLGFIGIVFSVAGAAVGGIDGVIFAMVIFNIVNLSIMAFAAHAR